MSELLHVLIKGAGWSPAGHPAIFVLPTYFIGLRVLPFSGSENIHSGAQALPGQQGPGLDGRTME